jgi:hypothetical protein
MLDFDKSIIQHYITFYNFGTATMRIYSPNTNQSWNLDAGGRITISLSNEIPVIPEVAPTGVWSTSGNALVSPGVLGSTTSMPTSLICNSVPYLTIGSNSLTMSNCSLNCGGALIHNVLDPVALQDAATKKYVDGKISNTISTDGSTPMLGNLNMNNYNLINLATPVNAQDATTKAYTDASYLHITGGALTGVLNMSGNAITNLLDPVNPQDAVTKHYVDNSSVSKTYVDATFLPLAGGTMTGVINMGNYNISNLHAPVLQQDATTKGYVDSLINTCIQLDVGSAAALSQAIIVYNNAASIIIGISDTLMLWTLSGFPTPNPSNPAIISASASIGAALVHVPGTYYFNTYLSISNSTSSVITLMTKYKVNNVIVYQPANISISPQYSSTVPFILTTVFNAELPITATQIIAGTATVQCFFAATAPGLTITNLNGEFIIGGQTTLYWSQGGNTLTGTTTLGSINAQDVSFMRNNVPMLNLTTSGIDAASNVISSVATPVALLDAVNKQYVDNNFLRLNGTSTMSGILNMGNNRITNLVDPINAQNAATKNYVDTNFATNTYVNSTFLPFSGGTMSGNINMNNNIISMVKTPINTQDAVNKSYVDTSFLKLDGTSIMLGLINMNNNRIVNLADPVDPQDAVPKSYLDGSYLNTTGGTMTGDIDMGTNAIINLKDPVNPQDAVTVNYVGTNYLPLAGGTMLGILDMGSERITNLNNPLDPQDAVPKSYLDSLIPVSIISVTPTMTSDTTPTPYVAYSPTGQAWNAFDGDAATAWTPTFPTTYVRLYFVYETYVSQVSITGSTGDNYTQWTIEGSDDGISYTTLLSSTDALTATAQIFTLTTTGYYRYYSFVGIVYVGTAPSVTEIVYMNNSTSALNHIMTNLSAPLNLTDAVNKDYVDTIVSDSGTKYLPIAGGTMSGDIVMNNNKITNLTDPTLPQDAATKNYVDTIIPITIVSVTPIMTSNITPAPYVVSASSELDSNNMAWMAFNIDTPAITSWSAAGPAPAWIQLKYGYLVYVTQITIQGNTMGDFTVWTIQGSTDGNTWVTLLTSPATISSLMQTFTLTSPGYYSYYKFDATASTGSNPGLATLIFQDTAKSEVNSVHINTSGPVNPTDVVNKSYVDSLSPSSIYPVVPDMFLYTYPTPYFVSASSELDNNSKAWNAFDGDGSTSWSTAGTATGWLELDYNYDVYVTQFVIAGKSSGENFTSWNIQGSGNRTTWNTILSSSIPITASAQTFVIPSPGYYKYYRFNGLTSTGTNPGLSTLLYQCNSKSQNNNILSGVNSPIYAGDAANKDYVDYLSGLTLNYVPNTIMTYSNISPPYIITASSEGTPACYAFDSTSGTAWTTGGQPSGWVQIYFGAPVYANAIAISGASNTDYFTTWLLQGSNNGTTFTTLINSIIPIMITGFRLTIPSPGLYTYYRFNGTTSVGSNPGIATLYFYSYTKPGNNASINNVSAPVNLSDAATKAYVDNLTPITLSSITPVMTSNTTPTPFIALASSELDSNNMAWNAFDGDDATAWSTAGTSTGWLQLYYGYEVYVLQVIFVGKSTNENFTSWNIEGSTDGNAWTMILSYNIPIQPSGFQTYTVQSPGFYSYYRFNGLTSTGTNPGLCSLTFIDSNRSVLGNTITNLSGPINPSDAATKNYVDNIMPQSIVSVTPIMTANATPVPYITSASSELDTNNMAWNAFDGSTVTAWSTAGTATGWIQLYYGYLIRVSQISITGKSTAENFTAWSIQGSNDGATWTTLLTSTTAITDLAQVFALTTLSYYTYYRFNGTASTGTNPGLSNLIFQDTSNTSSGNTLTHLSGPINATDAVNKSYVDSVLSIPSITSATPIMTANATPVPYIASASSELDGNNMAWNAFDGSTVTAWSTAGTATGWIQLYYVYFMYISQVSITGKSTGENFTAWNIQGSNNGTTWTTLLTSTTAITALAQTFTLTTPGYYKYYRFNGTASTGTNPGIASLIFQCNSKTQSNNKLTNVNTPINILDATNKQYVDYLCGLTLNRISPMSISSNISPPYIISASTEGTPAWWGFTGSLSNSWNTAGQSSGWLQVYYGSQVYIISITLYGASNTDYFTAWTFQGSNDGTTFTTLLTSTIGITSVMQSFTVQTPGYYSYYRLNATAATTSNNPGISYFGMFTYSKSGNNAVITNASGPINATDVVNKNYVDNLIPITLNSVTPIMTSNTTPVPYIASASTELNSSNMAWNAFDGSTTTAWSTAGVTTGWVQLYYGYSIYITQIIIKGKSSGGNFTAWNVQGSNDGTTWTSILSYTTIPISQLSQTFTVQTPGYYIYYRFNGTASSGGVNPGVTNLVFVDSNRSVLGNTLTNLSGPINPTDAVNKNYIDTLSPLSATSITPIMTSNTTPIPYITTASSEFSTSMQAWNAFDGNDTTSWATAGQIAGWLKINYGYSVFANQVSLMCNPTGETFTSWTIRGSNDDNSWTTLLTSNTTLTTSVQTFALTTPGFYTYYLFNSTTGTGTNPGLAILTYIDTTRSVIGNTITNLSGPINSTDAVNKGYVDCMLTQHNTISVTPIMTDYTKPSPYIITPDNDTPTTAAWMALDGNPATMWAGTNATRLTLYYNCPMYITQVSVLGISATNNYSSWKIAGSNNGSSYTQLLFVNTAIPLTLTPYQIQTPGYYSYYQFTGNNPIGTSGLYTLTYFGTAKSNTNNSITNLSGPVISTDAANKGYVDSLIPISNISITPTMTGYNTPTPYIVTAFNDTLTTAGWMAFDGNPSTMWASPDPTQTRLILQYNCPMYVTAVSVLGITATDNFTSWVLVASNDGVLYDTIFSVNSPIPLTLTTYKLLFPRPYTYYQFLGSGGTGNPGLCTLTYWGSSISNLNDTLTNLSGPINSTDAATKGYADNLMPQSVVSVTPVMTGYNTPTPYVATSIGNAPMGTAAWMAFDGDNTTSWSTNETYPSLTLQYGTPVYVTQISILATSATDNFTLWYINGSNNGTDYNLLLTVNGPVPTTLTTYQIQNPGQYLYYQFTGVEGTGSPGLYTLTYWGPTKSTLNNTLTNLSGPINSTDAATKGYADNLMPQSIISLTPVMTGYSTPAPYIVTALNDTSTTAGWMAFDGNDTTSWAATDAHILTLQYSVPVYITQVSILGITSTDNFTTWDINGSNNGTDYTMVLHVDTAVPTTLTTYQIQTPGYYSYYQFVGNNGTGIPGLYTLTYLGPAKSVLNNTITNLNRPFNSTDAVNKEYVDSLVSQNIVSVTPIMTSYTTPAPYVVTESSDTSSSTPGWKVFDGNPYSVWFDSNTNSWVTLQYGWPIYVTQVSVSSPSETDNYISWTILGSNDGVSYTQILYVNGIIPIPLTTYNIQNPGYYIYYRFAGNHDPSVTPAIYTITYLSGARSNLNKMITDLNGPINPKDAVNKDYVDRLTSPSTIISVTPIMTSYNTPTPFIVSVSDDTPTSAGWMAFDGIPTTSWVTTNSDPTLTLKYGGQVYITKVSILGTSATDNFTAWYISGSNDGSAYSEVLYINAPVPTTLTTYDIHMPGYYSYYQFGGHGGTGTPGLYTLTYWGLTKSNINNSITNLSGPINGTDAATKAYVDNLMPQSVVSVTPIMTGYATPAPYLVTTPNDTPTTAGWMVFDGDGTTSWATTDMYPSLTLQYGSPVYVTQISILATSTDNFISWFIAGSNNGTDYTHILDIIGAVPDVLTTYYIQNPSYYMYYQFLGNEGTGVRGLYTLTYWGVTTSHLNNTLTNLSGPVNSTDAATKAYVDNLMPMSVVSVTPIMTGYATPTPYLVTVSSDTPTTAGWMAFDGDDTTSWSTTDINPSITLQYGAPMYVTQVSILATSATDNFTSWSIFGSNDGMNYSHILDVTGAVPTVLTTYRIQIPDYYTYYQFGGHDGTGTIGLYTLTYLGYSISNLNNSITNLSGPFNPTDAVNKGYVDRLTSPQTSISVTPVMTSYNTPTPYVVIADHDTPSTAGWMAFDGNDGTSWAATGASTLTLYYGYPVYVAQVLILGITSTDNFTSWRILGSNDNVNYSEILSVSVAVPLSTTTYQIQSPNYYSYYQFNGNNGTGTPGLYTLTYYGTTKSNNNNTITDLSGPINATDAANKGYVDSILPQGIISITRTMTGYNTPAPYIVSADNDTPSTAAWMAFDGNDTTSWAATGATKLIFYFSYPVCATQITIQGITSTDNYASWNIQGSNDNVTYTMLYNAGTAAVPTTLTAFVFSVTGLYLYYRFMGYGGTGTPGLVSLTYYNNYKSAMNDTIINLSGPINPADAATKGYVDNVLALSTVSVTPVMTSNTTPAPYIVSASSESGTGNAAWMAFDNNPGTSWLSAQTTGWVQIYFGYSMFVNQVYINCQSAAQTFTVWNIAGSNDGTTWTTLLTSTVTIPTSLQPFTFSSTGFYTYYRFNGTASIGTNPGIASLMYVDTSRSVSGNTITNVNGPINPTDAVNKNYVDNILPQSIVSVTPTMTNYTTPVPYVVTANLDTQAAQAWMAFDGNAGTSWSSFNANTLTLYYSYPVYVIRVDIQGISVSSNYTSWSIQGSNDGTSFTTLLAVNTPLPIVVTTYKLDITGSYTYYRFSGSGGANNPGIVSLTYYGYSKSALNNTITNVNIPINPTDAATKAYADSVLPATVLTISPIMTSNTTPAPYVVTASSESGAGNAAWMVFDGNAGTSWAAAGPGTCWLQIYFGCPVFVSQVTIQCIVNTYTSWSINGSNVAGISTTLYASFSPITTTPQTFQLSYTGAYSYYKFIGTGGTGNPGLATLTLLGTSKSASGSIITNVNTPINSTDAANKAYTDSVFPFTISSITPVMTSNTTPAPYVVSASSVYSSSYAAWMAFDNNDSTTWTALALTGWLQIYFGSSVFVNQVSLYHANAINTFTAWNIAGSNDGTTWTTLLTSTVTITRAPQTFQFTSSGYYSYYRFNGTAATSLYPGLMSLIYGYASRSVSNTAITNVNTPFNSSDAATKGYVDNLIPQSTVNITPVMTGYNAPVPYTVGVAGDSLSTAGWMAFDGNPATMWSSPGMTAPRLILKYGYPVYVTQVSVLGITSTDNVTSWLIQGSNDNFTWTTVLSVNTAVPLTLTTYQVTSPGYYPYYQFIGSGGTGSPGLYTLTYWSNSKSSVNTSITNLNGPVNPTDAASKGYVDAMLGSPTAMNITPIMTSNLTPAPYVASASSELDGTHRAWYAFDFNNSATEWATLGTATGWVMLQFIYPMYVTQVNIQGRAGAANNFTSWNIQGSTDNITYTTLFSANTAVPTSSTTYQLSMFGNYIYYRFNGAGGTAANNPGLAILMFFTQARSNMSSVLTNVNTPTSPYDAVNKYYVDSSATLPTPSTSFNGAFLQILSGAWGMSGIGAIPITALDNTAQYRSGAVYTFNNGTVSNPIPQGAGVPMCMIVISNNSASIDNAIFLVISVEATPHIYVRAKRSGFAIDSWVTVF